MIVLVLVIAAGYFLFTKRYMFLSPGGVNILLNEQQGSGIKGNANLVDSLEGVKIKLEIDDPKGESFAQIRVGLCNEPGGVLYTLPILQNGAFETVINTSIASLLSQSPLVIEVIMPSDDPYAYEEYNNISCGEIILK